MRRWRVFWAISLVLVLGAGLPQVAEFLDAFNFSGPTADALRNLVKKLPSDKRLYMMAWIYGISLQYLLTALIIISPAARNAKRYDGMCTLLDAALADLGAVRDAAVADKRDLVAKFTSDISTSLRKEVSGWLVLSEVF